MSFTTTNCITKLLSLEDDNLIFSGEISESIVNKLKTIVFEATLTYSATTCPCCGNVNSNSIIKYGFKKTMVRILPINGQPAAINVKRITSIEYISKKLKQIVDL